MAEKRKNIISLDPKALRYIVAKDGRVFEPGKSGLIRVSGSFLLPADEMLALLDAAKALNSPGGKNFELTRRLLGSYRDLSFALSARDPFDLAAGLNDTKLPDAESLGPTGKAPAPSGRAAGTAAPLRSAAGAAPPPAFPQSGPEAQRPGASLIKPLQLGIEAMLSSPDETIVDAGELLYARFVKPEYSAKTGDFYMALFRCSRAGWFRMQNRAISLLSACVFGVLPDELRREPGTKI
ncbi:MAG: hypothetical protein IJM17_04990 [Firmicutes bacterium]|nr:hypothetical protein [Bacillota bacterium]